MKTFKLLIFSFLIVAAAGFLLAKNDKKNNLNVSASTEEPASVAEVVNPDQKKFLEIKDKDTYGKLMEDAGIGASMANEIYEAAKEKYDFVKIRLGKSLELVYEKDTDELKELLYKIDSEDEIAVKNLKYFSEGTSTSGWVAEVSPIKYEVKIVTKEGEVESSMYQAALDNNIDERAIIALADTFQWSIDFAMDPRVGDKFKFVYEERYLDGQYAMPGKVLAGFYVNAGTQYETYYFHESADNEGYFDGDGNSVQKMFLKAPVAFKYISSGFTTGLRYIKAFDVSTGHRAIDYAAAYGTPIRAVGDGTVTMASWNGSYGNMVKIRHNGTYSTNYAHMSKFAVKKGNHVKQGDVIGYVGSTGFSTGPHVHFEMVKNGVKINPLTEVLPPGQAIKDENRPRFAEEIGKWQEMLGLK